MTETPDEPPKTRNPIRLLYRWTMSWAEHPAGLTALFFIAVIESCVFPIPPDVLLIALAVGRPRRAFLFAAVCSAGSIIGGVIGYAIGLGVGEAVFGWLISEESVQEVKTLFDENAFLAILTSAFTPIPYKVFTIAAGFFRIDFWVFLAASAVGRSGRFFLVGTLLFFFGPPVKPFLERHLEWITVGLLILLIGGYLLMTWLL